MWSNLATLSVSPANLIIRGLAVFFFILLLLRVSGKRQIGQMGPTEFVALLLISNAVQNAMNAGDNSLVGGLILAAILIAASWTISWATFRSKKMRSLFEGTPTLLVHKGKILTAALNTEWITKSELMVLLRRQGLHDLSEIDSAILESDGHLSVTKKNDKLIGT